MTAVPETGSPALITSFTGIYGSLSSFCPAPFEMPDWPGITCLTREHAFQARKGKTDADRRWILSAPTPKEAKVRGREVQLRPGWEQDKQAVMLETALVQFRANPPMRAQLAATGAAILIEGNNWGDDYWGAVPREPAAVRNLPQDVLVWARISDYRWLAGQNWLGRVLMLARCAL